MMSAAAQMPVQPQQEDSRVRYQRDMAKFFKRVRQRKLADGTWKGSRYAPKPRPTFLVDDDSTPDHILDAHTDAEMRLYRACLEHLCTRDGALRLIKGSLADMMRVSGLTINQTRRARKMLVRKHSWRPAGPQAVRGRGDGRRYEPSIFIVPSYEDALNARRADPTWATDKNRRCYVKGRGRNPVSPDEGAQWEIPMPGASETAAQEPAQPPADVVEMSPATGPAAPTTQEARREDLIALVQEFAGNDDRAPRVIDLMERVARAQGETLDANEMAMLIREAAQATSKPIRNAEYFLSAMKGRVEVYLHRRDKAAKRNAGMSYKQWQEYRQKLRDIITGGTQEEREYAASQDPKLFNVVYMELQREGHQWNTS